MIRHCDGTDPGVGCWTGAPGKPMHCGRTFDDAEHSTLCPHVVLNRSLKLDQLEREFRQAVVGAPHADAILDILKRRGQTS
jgi:hypothetical protein